MIKWVELGKKNLPDFEEEVLIWVNPGRCFLGKRASTTETPEGLKHVFQCEPYDNPSNKIENATHYSVINGPMGWIKK